MVKNTLNRDIPEPYADQYGVYGGASLPKLSLMMNMPATSTRLSRITANSWRQFTMPL